MIYPSFIYYFQRKWKRESDDFFHFKHEEKKSDDVIPAQDLALQAIEYARELEMIVWKFVFIVLVYNFVVNCSHIYFSVVYSVAVLPVMVNASLCLHI